jgi:hypothetical protein
MNWNAEGQAVSQIVDDMRRRGVTATPEQVANALKTAPVTLATVKQRVAEACRAVGRTVDMLAAREAEQVAAMEEDLGPDHARVVAIRDGVTGAERMVVEPMPLATQDGQDDFAAELKKLTAKAIELQAVVDDMKLDAVTRERAQAELTPILERIRELEVATARPQTQMTRPTIVYEHDARGYIVGARKA